MASAVTKFTNLPKRILIYIFRDLAIADILAVRQTCRTLHNATISKQLWVSVYKEIAAQKPSRIVLPPHPGMDFLGSPDSDDLETEALVRRAARLGHLLHTAELISISPERSTGPSLNLSQPIHWLRLVAGRWLLVASSDHSVSKLSCWDLSLVTRGLHEPIAECYLTGQVKTGQVEIQSGAIIIALGVGPSRSSHVCILSLCSHGGKPRFAKLATLQGFSHVGLLRGQFVGCGLKDDISVPHLVNWRTQQDHPLATEPDVKGGFISLEIFEPFIFLATLLDLKIFSLPDDQSAPRLLQTLALPEGTHEVAFIRDPCEAPMSSHPFSARLTAMTKSGMLFLTLFRGPIDDLFCLRLTQEHDVFVPDVDYPWFNLRVGSTGRRVMWITPICIEKLGLPPRLTFGVLREEEALDTTALVLDRKVHCNFQDSPIGATLCAFSIYDFDDALGLVAVGNVYGELCLYDLVDKPSIHLWPKSSLTLEEARQPYTFASLTPLNLHLPPLVPIPPSVYQKTPCVSSVLNHCILRDLESIKLPGLWSTNWEHFFEHKEWQGFPGDLSWGLEHCYGFLGDARPLAFHLDACLLKAGGLYFLLYYYSDDDNGLLVFDNCATLVDIVSGLPEGNGISEYPTHPSYHWAANAKFSAEIQKSWYRGIWKKENANLGRNRWVELKARGGFPAADLQVMLPPRA